MNALRSLLICLLWFSTHLSWAASGEVDLTFDPNVSGPVYAVATQADGKIVIGGAFATVGGVTRHNAARLNPDGSLDASFDPNVTGSVQCVFITADGKIVIAGAFTAVSGYARSGVARLNPDGTLDSSFLDPGLNSTVAGIAVQSDGKVLVAIGGAASSKFRAKYFGRLNSDGTVDAQYNSNTGSGSPSVAYTIALPARCIMLEPNGHAWVSGQFGAHVVHISPDGFVEPVPQLSVNGSVVDSMAEQLDGRVLISGKFYLYSNPSFAPGVARFDLSGYFDTNVFHPAATGKLSLQCDGKLFAGGSRLNGDDGSLDSTMSGVPGHVTLQPDGNLLVAGSFTSIGGTQRAYLARVSGTPVGDSLVAYSNDTQVQWFRAGAAPEAMNVWFQVSTDGENTWTPLGQGSRIAGGWQLTGITLPGSGTVRALAQVQQADGTGVVAARKALGPDFTTDAPTLLSPLGGAYHSVPISYFLPEVALGGTTKLILSNGVATYALTLAPGYETAGAHAFSLNPAAPTSSPAVVAFTGGSSIPDGSYTLTVTYRDWFGNPIAQSAAGNVVIDTVAQAPLLTQPASNTTYGRTIPIQYSLPESAKPGTARLTFARPPSRTLSVDEAAGTHTTSLDPLAPATFLADGVYTVSLQYEDNAGNVSSVVTATNVVIDTVTQLPTLSAPTSATPSTGLIHVAFTLPENATSGTVTLSFGGNSLHLASSMEVSGTHTFDFDAQDPTASPEIASGAAVADGVYTVSLSYQDFVGNPAATVTYSNVVIDGHTQTPTLSQPQTNTTYTLGIPVSFNLPELALSGSVRLAFSDGVNTYTSILSASQESAGGHSFGFNPIDPTSASQVASGAPVPNGIYTVSISYRDRYGNAAASASVSGVQINATVVNLAMPGPITTEATGPGGAVVTFAITKTEGGLNLVSLSTDPPSGSSFPIGVTTVRAVGIDTNDEYAVGSLLVTVRDTTPPQVTATDLVVEATQPGGATIIFSNNTATDLVGVTSITYSPANGSIFRLGTTTVNVTARDAASNTGVGSFKVTVQDTTAPAIPGPFSPLLIRPGPLPNYAAQAHATDAVGVADVTQSPAAGTMVGPGTTQVTITAADAAGNIATKSFSVAVQDGAPLTTVQHVTLLRSGDLAPAAGQLGGPPADAQLTTFGSPAIDQDGTVAFVANWMTGDHLKGSGVFKGSTPFALAGDAALNGNGATYASFGDPIIAGGRVALLAKLAGGPKDGAAALISGSDPTSFGVYARTGSADAAPDTPYGHFGRFRKFTSMAIDAGGIAFLGQLTPGYGSPNTDATNDMGIWYYSAPGAAGQILLREGQQVDGHTITKIIAFQPGNGSPGQGRGWLRTKDGMPRVMALVYFGKERAQALVVVDIRGVPAILFSTGTPYFSFSNSRYSVASYRTPSLNRRDHLAVGASVGLDNGTRIDTICTTVSGRFDWLVTVQNYWFRDNLSYVTSVNDPVLADDDGIAFSAGIRDTRNQLLPVKAIVWNPPAGELTKVALTGVQPPGANATRWKTFSSLAIAANRGPIFTATLSLNGSRATAQGAWAVDSDGTLRFLFRTGVPFDLGGGVTKTLTRFSFLNASVGTTGMTRSFNDAGQFAWLATFSDKSQAIVLTEIP